MALEALATLRVDLLHPGTPHSLYAVQNESSARRICFALYAGEKPWPVPDGTLVTVRYKNPDGTAGFYDTLPDGQSAVQTEENTVAFVLTDQMLVLPGRVLVQLELYSRAGERLATFAVVLHVLPNLVADAEIVSSNYFNVLTQRMGEAIAATEGLEEYATAAEQAAKDAAACVTQAAETMQRAQESAQAAATSADTAQESATSVQGVAETVETSAANASAAAARAETHENTAAQAAADALTAATRAEAAEQAAAIDSAGAEQAAQNAAESAAQAENFAWQASEILDNTLPKSGGTMSGPLTLAGGLVPVALGSFTDMQTAGWAAVQAWYNTLPDETIGYGLVTNNQGTVHGLSGGRVFLKAFKTNASYGVIEATQYATPFRRYASVLSGEFSDFSS